MLELNDICLRQGDFTLRADWSVPPGAQVAVIGPSGSGKSTLLAAIAGFLPLSSGAIHWHGHAMPLAPAERPVAMLFQDNNLFPHLTVTQNVGLGLRPTLRLTQDDRQSVDLALAEVGLSGLGARLPGQLSGGQQSRAALARVLVQARPIILLDEPFAALGPALRRDMLGLVRQVAQRLDAILMVITHDPADAAALGGLAVFVDAGVAHAPVPTADLLADPPQALRDYLG